MTNALDPRVAGMIARHSKSFSLAARLLPPRARRAAAVVYAWCRRADDAVDRSADPARAAGPLREELDAVFAGRTTGDPVLDAFAQVVSDFRIPRLYPAELLAGMEMDARGTEYETLRELSLYCYRVAGTVGLMMSNVMGVSSEKALPHAAHLGMAMQFTNICRDVVEDFGRGRLYIPAELLSPADRAALAPPRSGALPRTAVGGLSIAMKQLLDLADRYYQSGDAGVRCLSPRCEWSIRTARLVYAAIGDRIRGKGCDPLAGRAYVPASAKLGRLTQALALTLSGLPRRWSPGGAKADETALEFSDVVLVE